MWKNTDAAGNSVIWAPSYVNKTPSRARANTLFGNTTGNGYITGLTVGMYGVDTNEMRAVRAGKVARPAHAGWVLKRTKGTRVMYETLVAMSSITSDAENTTFPSYALVYLQQPTPVTATVNASSNSNTQTYTVTVNSVPTGANVTTYWQLWNGSAFVNCTANATYANVTNTVLVVSANTLAGNTTLRAVIASANSTIANNVGSVNAIIIKTT